MLANAFDFVTLIRWIPSTHKIFENPISKRPLIKMRAAELLRSVIEKLSLSRQAESNTMGVLMALRTNKIISLLTLSLALC